MATINLSEETLKTSEEFITTIGEMFETVEMLAGCNRPMNEGEWLVLANQFKKLTEYKDKMKTTVVYVEHERNHTRGRVVNKKVMTKADKLKDPLFMMCPTCKKVMTKRHYAEKHKKSGICNHIQAVGNVASHNKAVVVSDARRVKISDVPIICDEFFIKRYFKNTKLVSVDIVTKQVTLYSIAHRSLILAELWKPIEVDSAGIRKIQFPLLESVAVELIGTNTWRMEDRQYGIRVEGYKMYDETEFGKWTKVDKGKYIPTVPKKKLRIITQKKKLVLEEPVCEKCHLIECCCEADRLQVIADDERAKAEGLVEVDGRWIKPSAEPISIGDMFYNRKSNMFYKINKLTDVFVWYDILKPENFDYVDNTDLAFSTNKNIQSDTSWKVCGNRLLTDDEYVDGYKINTEDRKICKWKKTEILKLEKHRGQTILCRKKVYAD